MRKMKYRVIVETDFRNRPKEHELLAAILIANHFKTNIVFLRPSCQHVDQKNWTICVYGCRWQNR